jgi:MFS family permease
VMVAVVAPLAGKLYPKLGPKKMLASAMIMFTGSSFLLLLVDLETSTFWIAGMLALRGIAMAFTFVPLQAAAFATISPADTGRASSIFNTNRQVASSFGVAILATVLAERTKHYTAGATGAAVAHGSLMGFHDAFFAAMLLSAIGFVFVFLINDADAVASMRPGRETAPEDAPVPVDVPIRRPATPAPQALEAVAVGLRPLCGGGSGAVHGASRSEAATAPFAAE